jgi:hypothetical protein
MPELNGHSADFSKIFGEPGQGFHAHFCGIAVWDVLLTIVAAVLLSMGTHVPFWRTALGLFLVGQGAHFAFGVDTAVTRWFMS